MSVKNKKRHLRALLPALSACLAAAALLAATLSAAADTVPEMMTLATGEGRVTLTAEEQAYLNEHPVITVAADASWRPLEYADADCNYAGVIAEVLTRLGNYTGFTVEYILKDSYTEALAAVQNDEACLISGLAEDEDMAKEYSVALSAPYLTINSAVVSKSDFAGLYQSSGTLRLAVVDGDYANTEIQRKIPNAELILCASNEACLDLVKGGEADAAIIASYCAEYYSSVPKYSSLHAHTIPDFSWQLAFGMSDADDPRMLSILNKGIEKLQNLDINEAVYEGITDAAYDNDVLIFVYRHPLAVIGVTSAVVLTVAALLLVLSATRKRADTRRLEDGTRLRLALERTHLCIWELSLADGSITQIDNAQEKHGFGDLRAGIPESVLAAGLIHPEDVSMVKNALDRVHEGQQNVQGCWRVREPEPVNGDTVYWWEQVLFRVVYDDRQRPIKVIGVSEDVTKEKNAQRDSLTLVYNRNSFEQRANTVLHERRNAYLQCAFIILDLDRFKQINDTYGHGMGDRVLISLGAVLNRTFRSTDIVGRLGGDEFTVFMTSISRREDAEKKARELVESVSHIQDEEGYEFPISCSVGVVVATKGHEDLPTLYKKADIALYAAKKAGKNQYRMYD